MCPSSWHIHSFHPILKEIHSFQSHCKSVSNTLVLSATPYKSVKYTIPSKSCTIMKHSHSFQSHPKEWETTTPSNPTQKNEKQSRLPIPPERVRNNYSFRSYSKEWETTTLFQTHPEKVRNNHSFQSHPKEWETTTPSNPTLKESHININDQNKCNIILFQGFLIVSTQLLD